MKNETQLVQEFAEDRSETAFAAIVRLHSSLVFSTALRQVGDRGMAEEITQGVFLALAEKAGSLKWRSTLAGWLYQTTLNQSRQRLRSEFRRQRREQIAGNLAIAHGEGESIWGALIPLLDEALLDLADRDRVALILHHIEGRPLREVGAALGVGEDAARKRINRVIDDLAAWFKKRGFAASAGAVMAALTVQSTEAISVSLSASIVSAACANSGAAALSFILMTTTQKISIAAVLIVLCSLAPRVFQNQISAKPEAVEMQQQGATPMAVAARGQTILNPSGPAAQMNFFERINQGDTNMPMLPREMAEAFIERNKTNAESLLAAFRVTNDTNYLRAAALKFPNDPTVILRVLGRNVFPEERKDWIDRLKKADPENALGDYLSARDRLQNKDYAGAFQDLSEANRKPGFTDYYNEQVLSLEEIYLDAGHTPAEAKALAMAATELPHLREMRDASKDLSDLVGQYQKSGDTASANAVIQQGLAVGNRLQSVREGGVVLGDLVGVVLERNFLRQLDPAQTYPFVNGSVSDRITELDGHETQIRANSEVFSDWIRSAPESDIVAYFDRVKLYGESSAIEWLKSRR